ncbi:MAG: hypothetical protein HKO62_14200, partial [Gammaproteobacteria bacterium]|nr:hypothetical protein [Gammaproteobacteria bacterium]
ASLVSQLIGIAVIFAWVFATSFVVWMGLKMTMGIRVSKEEEIEGLDVLEIGVAAYPEFTTAADPSNIDTDGPSGGASEPAYEAAPAPSGA